MEDGNTKSHKADEKVTVNGGKTIVKFEDGEDCDLDEGETFLEEFKCCVCLDLLYKPVVLACGHISCFWCIFKTMSFWHESYCPICRQPYNHFPSICQLLHFLLLKLYPIACKSRERQVAEEEKGFGCSSPQFDHILYGTHVSNRSNVMSSDQSPPNLQTNSCLQSCFKNGESSSFRNLSEITVNGQNNKIIGPESSSKDPEVITDATNQENMLKNNFEEEACNQISASYLLCAACKKLLFRPVVLNCGHVYCESCIFVPENEISKCQICQSLHPNGFPSVCLILHHFLEEQFPKMYLERQEALLNGPREAHQHSKRAPSVPTSVYSSFWFGNGPKVHIGVGCDSCGMSPIIGERYKCKDCTENIGFDLCEACHSAPIEHQGRFNQQHTPEHKFEIAQPENFSDYLFENAEDSDDNGSNVPEFVEETRASTFSTDVSQDEVDPAFILSVDISLDQEDDDSDDPASSDLT